MITYKKGSLVDQKGILLHGVNDAQWGAMGAGVAKALFTKWPKVRQYYMVWAKTNDSPELVMSKWTATYSNPFKLGRLQTIKVEDDVYVTNAVTQSDPGGYCGLAPIRYQSVEECLMRLKVVQEHLKLPVHTIRLGCGLAGGSWKVIEEIINRVGVDLTVWDIDDNWNA